MKDGNYFGFNEIEKNKGGVCFPGLLGVSNENEVLGVFVFVYTKQK